MSIENILKKAIYGVLNQGIASASKTSPEQCLYRSDDGCKCAVGHIISDEYYDETLETHSVRSDKIKKAVDLSNDVDADSDLYEALSILQFSHDMFTSKLISSENYYDLVEGKTFLETFIYHAKNPSANFENAKYQQLINKIIDNWVTENVALYKAIDGVVRQKKRSATTSGVACLYRNPDDGCRCAVGHIIEDEHYDINLEGLSVASSNDSDNIVTEAVCKSLNMVELSEDFKNQLKAVQRAHDSSQTPEFFVTDFKGKITELINDGTLPKNLLGALDPKEEPLKLI